MPKKKDTREGPILVPVDFSVHSAEATVWAARAADCMHTRLELLHVVHDPESAPGFYVSTKRKKHLHRLEEAAQDMFQEFLEKLRKNHPDLGALKGAEQILVIGIPVTRILEVARKVGAQMIVMGSRGLTGMPHLLLGSKAERIAQLSPIPVTVVKAREEPKHQRGDDE